MNDVKMPPTIGAAIRRKLGLLAALVLLLILSLIADMAIGPAVQDLWLAGQREWVKVNNACRQDILDRLREVNDPVLIIWGRQDMIVPSADALAYSEMLQNSRLEIFNYCGHIPMVEHPVRFNRLVEEMKSDLVSLFALHRMKHPSLRAIQAGGIRHLGATEAAPPAGKRPARTPRARCIPPASAGPDPWPCAARCPRSERRPSAPGCSTARRPRWSRCTARAAPSQTPTAQVGRSAEGVPFAGGRVDLEEAWWEPRG